MDARPTFVGLTKAEIQEALGGKQASMRASQIAKWIYQRAVLSFDEMTDLPAAFRQELKATYREEPLVVAKHARSVDDVDKLLVHGGDEQVFECVLLPYKDRVSCCLSSQVGCPMGCTFCATGLGGFDRNLSVAEMVGQYLLLQQVRRANVKSGANERVDHVVFMGMGEPLLNLQNLVKTMRLLHDEVGLSYRHITVSTVGIVPQIRELAKLDLPIHLALSLHSPDDAIRSRLMPVNKKWPVAEVMAAMRDYQRATGRKITIEYLLIGGLTDSESQARDLARLIRGVPSLVNVIPFNYVATEQGYQRPTREQAQRFLAALRAEGANASQRMERGHEIAAACGQLAGHHAGRFAKRIEGAPVRP